MFTLSQNDYGEINMTSQDSSEVRFNENMNSAPDSKETLQSSEAFENKEEQIIET